MMKYTLTFLFTAHLTFAVFAQNKQDYTRATELAIEANQQLLKGEVKRADSLIRKSLAIYPTMAVYDYALSRAELPDISGANLVMDIARTRVLTFKHEVLWVDIPFKGLVECNKYYAYFGFLLKAYEVNKAFGERRYMEYSLMEAAKVSFAPMNAGFDYYSVMQQVLKTELLCVRQQYQEAAYYIQQAPPHSIYASWETKIQALVPILCELGDYQSAARQINILSSNPAFRNAVNSWMFYINAMTKNNEAAMNHFRQLPADFVEANLNANHYVLGLIAINEQKFEEAIHHLQISVSKRGNKGNEVYMLVEKWKVYKALGDAYAGLKMYEKARDHYQVALLAWPEYAPAVQAMATLDKTHLSEVASDKKAPVISLTEPSASRGFVVTETSATVLIKGFASDPSGIAGITINGREVYNQKDGNFWGEIPLADGKNKIVVAATDLSGNRGEQIFELEKKPGSSIAESPVKPGKNYALLLAAQNYQDNAIPSLENPVADAVKLKLILKNDYNFAEEEIITLFNPASGDLRSQLLELRTKILPEDNLVIFYAGHGIWQEKEKKGYWMMTDAILKDPQTWFSNQEMLELIAALPARHTLLITDACFSGSVFKTRKVDPDMPIAIRQVQDKISRVAITSGNDTEVPDKSVFMKYLVKALSENKEKYLTAQKMFVNHIIEAVMTESRTEPRYGTLEMAGHVGGDFIFMKN